MRRAGIIVLLCLAGVGGGADARAGTVPLDVTSRGDHHIVYPPYASPDRSNPSALAAGVGDVDGDGLEDVAMVLDSFEPSYPNGAYVSFGSAVPGTVTQAGAPGWRGFRIVGEHLHPGLAGLGDVNGDGRGEIAVTDYDGVAVVFGRADGQTVDVRSAGDWGFRIRNAGASSWSGFGTTSGGLASVNTVLADAGDQNGDGRPDLAMVARGDVVVVYTPPLAAGTELDAAALGTQGFRLVLPGRRDQASPSVSRAGDLNGDGRQDLTLTWDERDPRTGRAAGVVSPGPGATVEVGRVAENAAGWELDAPGAYLENGLAVGDQNADGRRDVLLVAVGEANREGLLAYAPPLGAERTVRPFRSGEGERIEVYNGNVVDVGDQDGDGRSDLAFGNYVRGSATGAITSAAAPTFADAFGSVRQLFLSGNSIVVSSVADVNADGKRELVTVESAPTSFDAPYAANWKLDVFASAPVPLPLDIPVPTVLSDAVDFAATFAAGTAQAAAGRLLVEIDRPGQGRVTFSAPQVARQEGGRVRAGLRVAQQAAGLVPGQRYGYKVLLENGWGLVGASPPGSFTFGAGTAPAPGTATPPPAGRRVLAPTGTGTLTSALRVFVGTRRGDRLIGTAGRDRLRGFGGADRLRGLAGDDHLEGGAGNDRLDGGPGRDRLSGGPGADLLRARDATPDVVACGTGRKDVALVDRRDRVSGCETVKRR